MLKKLRNKKTAKKVWVVLAILIVPAFVLWGSGSLIRTKEKSAYEGKIFGRKISALEFSDALEAVRNLAIIQYGDNFSQIQKQLNLEAQAWERLILLAEAKRRKIGVSDKELALFLESYPFFQRNGKFDQRIYSDMLQFVFHTQPRIFEEQIRQNLMVAKLYRQVSENVKLSEQEIKDEYRKINEQANLDFIAALPSDFSKTFNSQEKEIREYFEKNRLQFKQPLSFNIEYLAVAKDKKDAASLVKKIFTELKKTSDPEKLAKGYGLSIKESGLFAESDSIPGIGWSPQITNFISKAAPGRYLNPIEAQDFYYIIKLKEKKEPYIPEFNSIKKQAEERYLQEMAKVIAAQKIQSCLQALVESYKKNPKAFNFQREAKTFGLKTGSTGMIKFGSYIEGIGVSDKFLSEAQQLKEERNFSGIIEMPAGFYIVMVKSRIPIDEKKFEAEKESFTQGLLLEKKQERFNNFLEDLRIRAQKP